jgi:hypothetical protein
MAYHFFQLSARSGQTVRGYNIDFSVGRGGANRKDDGMLVQTLLRIVYIENTDPELRSSRPPLPDNPDIVVDGIVGPTTQRYIMHFKNQARQRGLNLHPDEIMDPFRGNDANSQSTISKTRYAFGVLVANAHLVDEKSGLGKFAILPEHPETHPTLRLALTQTRRDAQQYTAPAAQVPATGGV